MTTTAATPKYADGSEVPDHIDATTRAWLDGVDPATGARVEPQPAPAAAKEPKPKEAAPKATEGKDAKPAG